MPNLGLPMRLKKTKTHRFTKKNRLEQKIPGKHKIRSIFVLSTISGYL